MSARTRFPRILALLGRLRPRISGRSTTCRLESESSRSTEPPAIEETEFNAFHPFPRLPTELRCLVWSFTTPAPRVLEIVWSGQEWQSVSASRVKPNYAIQASREAYEVFLMNWSPFCKHQALDTVSPAEYPLSYINPKIDTVYIGGVSFGIDSFSHKALEALEELPGMLQLRHLAMEISEWHKQEQENKFEGKTWEIDFLFLFPKLELFTIADYDLDWAFIQRGKERPVGEITLVDPIQIEWENELEMWPRMEIRLNRLRKTPEGKVIPKAQVKEVLRGSERMTYNVV